MKHHLPKRVGCYEQVAVKKLPWMDTDQSRPHESLLCKGIDDVVIPGDFVLLLGTGVGVSTVHASVMAGKNGQVIAIDAAEESIKKTKETIEYNLTPAPIKLQRAIIDTISESSRERYGNGDGADKINVNSLPDCDALIMDIEGAEKNVLSDMRTKPRAIVVESHGFLNAPTDWVVDNLEKRGYKTTILGAEVLDLDIKIVVGELRSTSTPNNNSN